MKTGKRIIAVLLCMIMLFGTAAAGGEGFAQLLDAFIVSASADGNASGTCGDNLTWEYDESTQTLTINGSGAMNNYGSMDDDHGFIGTSAPWGYAWDYGEFDSYCYRPYALQSVIIESGVTSIGNYAFYYCRETTGVTIPYSVTRIGSYAFYNCSSLNEITIYNENCDIAYNAFSVGTTIKGYFGSTAETYANDYGLNFVAIQHTHTFGGRVTTPSTCSVAGTKTRTCSECGYEDVEYLPLANHKDSNSDGVCDNCSAALTGTWGENISWVFNPSTGRLIFTGTGEMLSQPYCYSWAHLKDSIKSVVISNGITNIPHTAFKDFSALTSITIPDSVTSIGAVAFYNTAYYNDASNWEDGVLYIGNYLIAAKWGETTGSYSIKEGTTCIADFAFWPAYTGELNEEIVSKTWITSLTVPASVRNIGCFAFAFNRDLKTVYFNAASVYENSYYDSFGIISGAKNIFLPPFYASGVEKIYIGDDVEALPGRLFAGCDFLENVYFPDSVVSVGGGLFDYKDRPNGFDEYMSYMFREMYGISKVPVSAPVLYVYEGSYAYTVAVANGMDYAVYDESGAQFTIKNSALTGFEGTTQNIVVPSGVTHIGSGAFKGNGTVNSVEIPYSVSVIGAEAFAQCSALQSVIVPFTVTKIGKNAFDGTNAVIYCYYNSYAYNYAVANNIPFEIITVSFAQSSLNLGRTASANLGAAPSVAIASGLPMVFKSVDASIAAVDAQGNVTGVSEGSTRIEVYTETNNYLGSCAVTVNKGESISVIRLDANGGWFFDGTAGDLIFGAQAGTPLSKCWEAAEVPSRDGYRFAGWNPEMPEIMPDQDLELYAVWEPLEYIATLMVDGKKYKEETYTYGQQTLSTAVPPKEGYTGEWEPYTLGIGGTTITAVYTPITYYAIFVADGKQVAKLPFTVENKAVNAPAVPAKQGYTGRWSAYILEAKNVTVTAIYEKNPVTPSNPTADAKIKLKPSQKVEYRAKVTVVAETEKALPSGYILAIYEGNSSSPVQKGDGKTVSYTIPGEMKTEKTYTVKVIEKTSGVVQKDADGRTLASTIKIEVKNGFFDRLIAFFKGLFGLLPNVTIKP